MNYFVYMLKSEGYKPITYVGFTKNMNNRLKLHNSGKGAKFTRGRKWKIIYKEKFSTKREAILREYFLKHNIAERNKIKKRYL